MITRTLVLSLLFLLVLPLTSFAATHKKAVVGCTLTSTTHFVQPGEKVTITWKATNAFFGFGPSGARISTFGSMDVTPTETTIYKFKFLGLGTNEQCGVRVRVAGDVVPA